MSEHDDLEILATARCSDADRDKVISRLREGYADGSLGEDVFWARLGKAANAKTLAELNRLLGDLPKPAVKAEVRVAVNPGGPSAWVPARKSAGLALLGVIPAVLLTLGALSGGFSKAGGVAPALAGIGVTAAIAWFVAQVVGNVEIWLRYAEKRRAVRRGW